MKVYLSKYRDHWLSPYTILEKICFWRVYDQDDPWVERWADRLQPLCEGLRWVLDRIHPPVTLVKIDHYDTWNMDHTLAHIILPMLRQLKATKHGSAQTDLEDVPEHLHPKVAPSAANNYDDETVHERWEWVLNEMIWAFEQQLDDDDESRFYDHSGVDNSAPLNTQLSQMKVDREGLEAHQKRKANGFRLFGKYYQGLWD
jgi:hypothetical protein